MTAADAPTEAPPTPTGKLPTYAAVQFAQTDKDCDLVMKGGITSGIVYPYTVLELAQVYRLRSVGGTSAGAIAAAFAAAAEYARQVRKDPGGFVRLQQRCNALPDLLEHLFQPSPQFAGLMRFLLLSQRYKSPWLVPLFLIGSFWLTSLASLLVPGLAAWKIGGGTAAVCAAALGLIVGLVVRLGFLLVHGLPGNGFGMCHGRRQPGAKTVALMEWVHEALQDIAFGDASHPTPLTFGDLTGPDRDHPIIDLRMITTNMSAGRPHTLPGLPFQAGFTVHEWAKRFPAPVMAYLQKTCRPWTAAGTFKLPAPDAFPVVVAVRMSLSFPVLFSAVPLVGVDTDAVDDARDQEPDPITQATLAARGTGGLTIWMTDGGISSNFPIHMFDAPLPGRPTFALSLDELRKGVKAPESRVWLPTNALQGVYLPIKRIKTLGDFGSGILNAAKDWQDQLLSAMPGQRERIAHVLLDETEGGLNLQMAPKVSQNLMWYGLQAGQLFKTQFDFDEHRWRRSLVFYEQLEGAVLATNAQWTAGYGAFLSAYMTSPKSYPKISKLSRAKIHQRITALSDLEPAFKPVIPGKDTTFPRPAGLLRITPKF